ncbi:MAG: UPF0175 family protein [Candidatus Thermoplasmatota archaeon]|jgi:predicted HTH domain antitoxin|nr:UPF0175 family protein [Candidatus Thermoplasmatota archaeon]MDP7265050.1 UPF0175 family protein [Candidatus Thermoplasmatota archaeon]
MVSAFSLPPIMEMEIESLVHSGYYSSKSDVIKDAFRVFLENRTQLKTAAAIELYKMEKVSLGKAAEISELSIEEFKEILLDRGIKIVIHADPGIDKNVSEILEARD